jgi:hypothetical protein
VSIHPYHVIKQRPSLGLVSVHLCPAIKHGPCLGLVSIHLCQVIIHSSCLDLVQINIPVTPHKSLPWSGQNIHPSIAAIVPAALTGTYMPCCYTVVPALVWRIYIHHALMTPALLSPKIHIPVMPQ